jgi:hypothetical protein
MDAHCRWRKDPLWNTRKGFVRSGPTNLGLTRDYTGDFLVTIRDFGKSRLTGILPLKPAAVQGPPGAYDLLRGGLAAERVNASPEQPALFVERPSRIAKLTINRKLEIALTDDAGAPVDLSVAHVEVFDPAGNLVHHYSGNVTLRDGQAGYQIPFALSDPAGAWRIRVRDVISGLTAQVVLNR